MTRASIYCFVACYVSCAIAATAYYLTFAKMAKHAFYLVGIFFLTLVCMLLVALLSSDPEHSPRAPQHRIAPGVLLASLGAAAVVAFITLAVLLVTYTLSL